MNVYTITLVCATYDMHNSAQDPFSSYDAVDQDQDPMAERYDRHGTPCAGIVSAAKNTDTCGVGIAYNSNLAGKLSCLGRKGFCSALFDVAILTSCFLNINIVLAVVVL